MEQTFADLYTARRQSTRGLFGFVLWIFLETAAGIVRERVLQSSIKGTRSLTVAVLIGFT